MEASGAIPRPSPQQVAHSLPESASSPRELLVLTYARIPNTRDGLRIALRTFGIP